MKKFLILIFIILVVLFLFKPSKNDLTLKLKGQQIVELSLGEKYFEKGYQAMYHNKDVTNKVNLNGTASSVGGIVGKIECQALEFSNVKNEGNIYANSSSRKLLSRWFNW